MSGERRSGVLLHITSLPGAFGIGDLGPAARGFVDFLSGAGQRIWQVLPVGATGSESSPYQCFSAFAGNPLLISLEVLVEEGWLSLSDLETAPAFPAQDVNYAKVRKFKLPLLDKSYERFVRRASPSQREDFESFCHKHREWLEDFSLFMAARDAHDGKVWTQWEEGIAQGEPEAVSEYRRKLKREIDSIQFQQYQFFKQWKAFQESCHQQKVQIMGDIPIFVAHNSADVWAHRKFFLLDEQGNPSRVAGVPPDYFSETGQRWGNPLYRWDRLAERGYQWWIDRFAMNLSLFDMIKLDHFRGFEAYWVIPASERTAMPGEWIKGPGVGLFDRLKEVLGELPVVAENLGLITPEVEALRKYCGFPGMAVLQFAFRGENSNNSFLPHNHSRDLVVYTGTHDNDTTVGWWRQTGGDKNTETDREIEKERKFAGQYLNSNGHEIHWSFIRAALASVADTAIIPLQDLLGLGSEARMNVPGQAKGNWRWRCQQEMLSEEVKYRFRELTQIYGRCLD